MNIKSIIAAAVLVPMIAGCTYNKTVPSRSLQIGADTFMCGKSEEKTEIKINDSTAKFFATPQNKAFPDNGPGATKTEIDMEIERVRQLMNICEDFLGDKEKNE